MNLACKAVLGAITNLDLAKDMLMGANGAAVDLSAVDEAPDGDTIATARALIRGVCICSMNRHLRTLC